MRAEYDRDICISMFQCVDEWGGFGKNVGGSKAGLVGGEKTDDGAFVREILEDVEFDVKSAARVCPVEAICILDNDGEQPVP